MTFPASPRIEFEHNPLAEVICQLNYPEILAVGQHPPVDFQDRIREQYPLYERQGLGLQPPGLQEFLKQLPLVLPEAGTAHHFQTADRTRTIALTNTYISISEKRYVRWSEFRDEIERAKAAFEDVYRPSFYQRLALRYQDLIDRHALGLEGQPWSELIDPALAGVLAVPQVHSAVQQIGGNALLDNTAVPGGKIRLQYGLATAAETQRQVFVVDADIYTEEQHQRGDIYGALDAFNVEAGNLFRWAIRPALRDALGRRNAA
jgi:uncharacterized protein (TIGR04255 family)